MEWIQSDITRTRKHVSSYTDSYHTKNPKTFVRGHYLSGAADPFWAGLWCIVVAGDTAQAGHPMGQCRTSTSLLSMVHTFWTPPKIVFKTGWKRGCWNILKCDVLWVDLNAWAHTDVRIYRYSLNYLALVSRQHRRWHRQSFSRNAAGCPFICSYSVCNSGHERH